MVTPRTLPSVASIRKAWRRWSAERIAGRASGVDQAAIDPPPGFVVGCGPSGTAPLDAALAAHPQVRYLAEPTHYWAAIDRRTDVSCVYDPAGGMFFMDTRHASGRAKVRFNRLVHRARGRAPVVIEATAHNVCRIAFLEALAPGARYFNLVRCGLSAARCIDRVASLPAEGSRNPWWGPDDGRWAALARDGATAGYFAEEVGPLESHLQRGAYEWLVSLAEADRWRHRLGARFAEVTWATLLSKRQATLAALCAHFGISPDVGWISQVGAALVPERHEDGEALRLPPRMMAAFNAQQERYGFKGRAEPM